MFNGYPKVGVATDIAPIDRNFEKSNTKGCVLTLNPAEVESVEIDLQAMLRIVKHSNDVRYDNGSGKVAGLQIGNKVLISSAYPSLRREFINERDDLIENAWKEQQNKESDATEAKAMAYFKASNLDTNIVGSYAMSSVGRHHSHSNINILAGLLDRNSPAVLVIYDKQRSELGQLHLKAYTLTKAAAKAMFLVKDAKLKKVDLKKEDAMLQTGAYSSGVFREVPISIRPSLEQQLLMQDAVPCPKVPSVAAMAGSTRGTEYLEKIYSTVTKTINDKIAVEQKWRNNYNSNNGSNLWTQVGGTQVLKLDAFFAIESVSEQAAHLEAVCDSILLNLAVAKKI